MNDTPVITNSLLDMYSKNNSWPTRLNFHAFLSISGLNAMPRTARILDLGCGSGILLHLLKQSGFQELWGIDASPEMVTLARNFGAANIICDDATNFTRHFSEKSLDVIVICCLLHHIPDEAAWNSMLASAAAVLTGGGCLIIREPYPNLTSNVLKFLSRISSLHRGFLKPHLAGYEHERHFLDYFMPRWRVRRKRLLEMHGYAIHRDFNWWVHRITTARKE